MELAKVTRERSCLSLLLNRIILGSIRSSSFGWKVRYRRWRLARKIWYRSQGMYIRNRNHSLGMSFILGESNKRSPENNATSAELITPRLIWNRSNLPERKSQKTNMMKKVSIKGRRDLSFLFEVDGLSFDWACPTGFEFPLFWSGKPLHSLLFKWFLRFIDRSQPNMTFFPPLVDLTADLFKALYAHQGLIPCCPWLSEFRQADRPRFFRTEHRQFGLASQEKKETRWLNSIFPNGA